MMRHLNGSDVQKLSKNKFISIKKGGIIIELVLIKHLDEDELTQLVENVAFSISDSIRSCIRVLHKLESHVFSKLFVNISLHKLSGKLQIKNIMMMNPSSNILNTLDATSSEDEINVQEKYAYPASLQFVNSDVLLYYFKKYLSQYVYKSESVTPETPVITVNNKYVVDGKFNFFRHCINDYLQPIYIINMVNAKHVHDLIRNINMPPITNTKIPLFKFMTNPDVDVIKERIKDNSIPDNILQKFKKIVMAHVSQ